MIFNAYHFTLYIKIRGKIYAYYVTDSLPGPSPDGTLPPGAGDPDYDPAPDSYGGTATAKKTWWSGVFGMVILVVAIDLAKPWHTAMLVGAVVVFAPGYGYSDASWGDPVARGQRLQFVIIAIITAGVFTAFYLAAYRAGRRWPWRYKRSLEYRAHPSHQKRWP
ncbi:hypothetical protein [Mycobacterium sp. SM1]|uniref:hypothetical protein n=1 Tax=Mycobacterium sp. SM1 TaxID=2816243 RepID=UPI001F3F10CD|nr:hypothetical protein [Mycobacterium sp. SM1]